MDIGDKSIEEKAADRHVKEWNWIMKVSLSVRRCVMKMDRSLLMSLNVLVTINLSKELSHSVQTREAKLFKMLMRL